jgi:hypothetical protein
MGWKEWHSWVHFALELGTNNGYHRCCTTHNHEKIAKRWGILGLLFLHLHDQMFLHGCTPSVFIPYLHLHACKCKHNSKCLHDM